MRFSEHFGIIRTPADDWFDLLLSTDTKLFVDPFRIWDDADSYWAGAHDKLLSFFNMVLQLVARSGQNRDSAHWNAVKRLMMFPEPNEFCLGYSQGLPLGSGSGRGLQRGMLEGAAISVQLGICEVRHFEELSLFEAGIGADRISDIVCNVLKHEFIAYTQRILDAYDVEIRDVPIVHNSWSSTDCRWSDGDAQLAVNPYTNRGVLLVPRRFLRSLPTVDPDDFWSYAWSNENANIRGEFNYDIARNVDAETIARLARQNPDIAANYLQYREDNPLAAYDLVRDPLDRVSWYESGKEIAQHAPLSHVPESENDFCEFVGQIVEQFRNSVENQGDWRQLWHNNETRNEKLVQQVFRSTVTHYCRANNIDLSPESNAGRGPVDFKFSRGWEARALVEVKLMKNTKFWEGINVQTPIYLRAEEIRCGYFLAVGFRDMDFEPERLNRVRAAADAVSRSLNISITPVFVDARPQPSASRAHSV